jgi:hypothetical protein
MALRRTPKAGPGAGWLSCIALALWCAALSLQAQGPAAGRLRVPFGPFLVAAGPTGHSEMTRAPERPVSIQGHAQAQVSDGDSVGDGKSSGLLPAWAVPVFRTAAPGGCGSCPCPGARFLSGCGGYGCRPRPPPGPVAVP